MLVLAWCLLNFILLNVFEERKRTCLLHYLQRVVLYQVL